MLEPRRRKVNRNRNELETSISHWCSVSSQLQIDYGRQGHTTQSNHEKGICSTLYSAYKFGVFQFYHSPLPRSYHIEFYHSPPANLRVMIRSLMYRQFFPRICPWENNSCKSVSDTLGVSCVQMQIQPTTNNSSKTIIIYLIKVLSKSFYFLRLLHNSNSLKVKPPYIIQHHPVDSLTSGYIEVFPTDTTHTSKTILGTGVWCQLIPKSCKVHKLVNNASLDKPFKRDFLVAVHIHLIKILLEKMKSSIFHHHHCCCCHRHHHYHMYIIISLVVYIFGSVMHLTDPQNQSHLDQQQWSYNKIRPWNEYMYLIQYCMPKYPPVPHLSFPVSLSPQTGSAYHALNHILTGHLPWGPVLEWSSHHGSDARWAGQSSGGATV